MAVHLVNPSHISFGAGVITPRFRSRLAFVLISKLYRQMYAGTGMSTDSESEERAARWARWIAKPTRRLFAASPMPDPEVPA